MTKGHHSFYEISMAPKVKQIFDFMVVSEKLKQTLRWKNTPEMEQKETSADHSWHMSLFSLVVATELGLQIDLKKALKIALVHDLVEAITDDIDSIAIHRGIKKAEDKNNQELKAIKKLRKLLPKSSGSKIFNLWKEYEELSTDEARFIYAMDKLEGIHHMVYKGHNSFHKNGERFIGTYTNKAVSKFPELKVIIKEHLNRLKIEYKKHGWEWNTEYELEGMSEIENNEKIKQIFDFISVSEKLKETKRWLHTKEMIQKESSADHSWHLALLSFIVIDELNLDLDDFKSIKLALVHDLVEALVGDTDFSLIAFGHKTKEEKNNSEREAIIRIREMLPSKSGNEIYELWHEYEGAKTKEAKFIKALDKVEGINHMLCIGHECFDYPELIAPYPMKAVMKYPKLIYLYQELLDRLKPEFLKHGWKWLKEYNVITN
jgi:putative hydrolase of HD superfamily